MSAFSPGAPVVSVIVPTRHRPELFRHAVAAIAAQSERRIELIVVDDGSDGLSGGVIDDIFAASGLAGKVLHLRPALASGSGPSVARNAGLAEAGGEYIAFCDDDDTWTDVDHLASAVRQYTTVPDLDFFFADQVGVRDGAVEVPHWLPWLGERTAEDRVLPAAEILRPNRFPHLNTVVVRRRLALDIGGFCRDLPYSEDMYFSLRCLDAARRIYFRNVVVAQHNIPNRAKQANASTSVSDADKLLMYLNICSMARVHLQDEALIGVVDKLESDSRKFLTEYLISKNRIRAAAVFSRSVAAFGQNWKWFLFSSYLRTKYRLRRILASR